MDFAIPLAKIPNEPTSPKRKFLIFVKDHDFHNALDLLVIFLNHIFGQPFKNEP